MRCDGLGNRLPWEQSGYPHGSAVQLTAPGMPSEEKIQDHSFLLLYGCCRAWHAVLNDRERALSPKALGPISAAFPSLETLDLRNSSPPQTPGQLASLAGLKRLRRLALAVAHTAGMQVLAAELPSLAQLTSLHLCG